MQVTIEKVIYGGDGLVRTEQGVIFVPRTAPGDVVDVEITERKKDYAKGRVLKVVKPSPDRQETDCPNYMMAGCCHWEHIRYDRQLEHKEAIVRESLKRLGKIDFAGTIKRISGPDHAYRLRASFHVRDGRLGFLRENSHYFVNVSRCSALVPEINAFIPAMNAVLDREALSVDVVAGTTGLAATLTFDAEVERPWQRYRDIMFENIPGLAALTFVIGGRRLHYAKHAVEIEAAGFKFGLSSNAFFQANRFLLTPFIHEVVAQAGQGSARVLDLFCGAGFFSIPLAHVSRQLIGVESSRDAVKQAEENARANGVLNAEFAAGQVETAVQGTVVEPDLVLLNPPRTGAGAKVAELIGGLKARRLVYVSCNPTTFAREVVVFARLGYSLKQLTMLDQFPNTYHIELIGQLELE